MCEKQTICSTQRVHILYIIHTYIVHTCSIFPIHFFSLWSSIIYSISLNEYILHSLWRTALQNEEFICSVVDLKIVVQRKECGYDFHISMLWASWTLYNYIVLYYLWLLYISVPLGVHGSTYAHKTSVFPYFSFTKETQALVRWKFSVVSHGN